MALVLIERVAVRLMMDSMFEVLAGMLCYLFGAGREIQHAPS